MSPSVIFLMADYGHDPSETAIPWQIFQVNDFEVTFATEQGKTPRCDDKMLSGWTGAFLGATSAAKKAYESLSQTSQNFQNPLAWDDESFSLDEYDLVFLPGGHDKGIRQIIESPRVQSLLSAYFVQTQKPSKKSVAAICHGVQVLATASTTDGLSIIHDALTTALPAFFEQSIFQTTRIVLGDYYKTYGANSDTVEAIVTKKLDDKAQFRSSLSFSPFIVEDFKYNYLSGRFPGDAELLAKSTAALVLKVTQST